MSHVVMKKTLAKALMDAGMDDAPGMAAGGMAAGAMSGAAMGTQIAGPGWGTFGGAVLGGLAGSLGDTGGGAQQNYYNDVVRNNWTPQIQGYMGREADTFQQQQSLAQMLLSRAEGNGPSPAQTMLAQQTGQNAQMQGALMASQRGGSANPALMARQAAMQGANIQQQGVGQAATLKAQEQIAAQQALAQQQAQMAAQSQGGANSLLNAQGTQNSTVMGGQEMGMRVQQANDALNQDWRQRLIGGGLNAYSQYQAMNPGGNPSPQGTPGGGLLGVNTQLGNPQFMGPQQPSGMTGQLGSPQWMGHSDGGEIQNYLGGGRVPGTAHGGDSPKNDTQPAMLSPGEIVIPRSITMSKNAPQLASEFVKKILGNKESVGYEHLSQSRKSLKGRVDALEKMFCGGMKGSDGGEVGKDGRIRTYNPKDPVYDIVKQDEERPSDKEGPRALVLRPGGGQVPGYADGGLFGQWGQKPAPQPTDPSMIGSDPRLPGQSTPDLDQVRPLGGMADVRMKDALISSPPDSTLNLKTGKRTETREGFDSIMQKRADEEQVRQDTIPSATENYLTKSLLRQQKAVLGAGGAESAGLQRESKIRDEQAVIEQKHLTEFNDYHQGKLKEFDTMASNIAAQKIDPDNYWVDHSRHNAAVSVALGAMGQALLKQGTNGAMDIINRQIDRDVDAQKTNLESKHNLLKENMEIHKSAIAGEAAYRAQLLAMYSGKIASNAAKTNSAVVMENAKALKEKIGQEASDKLRGLALFKTEMQVQHEASSIGKYNLTPEEIDSKMGGYMNVMRMINPAKAEDLQKRAVPGYGFAIKEVPNTVHDKLASGKDFYDLIDEVQAFSKEHGFTMGSMPWNYETQRRAETMTSLLNEKFRQANKDGVFKPAEIKFVQGLIPQDPLSFFNKTTLEGYETLKERVSKGMNEDLSAYGIPVPDWMRKAGIRKEDKVESENEAGQRATINKKTGENLSALPQGQMHMRDKTTGKVGIFDVRQGTPKLIEWVQ